MAPKAKGRDVAAPEGLPPGWKAVEKTYLSGRYAGDTYIRFDSVDGKHKTQCSVKNVIKIWAVENGLDPDDEVAKYEQVKEDKKQQAAAEREKLGILKGQKREEAVEHFEAVHGKLDGPTIMALPGWRGESKKLENCGQISACYYDPDGKPWKLVKDIEAMFGNKMLNGDTDLPDFDLARSNKDESHSARKNVQEQFEYSAIKKERVKKRPKFKVVSDSDYKPRTKLAVSKIDNIDDDSSDKSKKRKSSASDAESIYKLLEQRAFTAPELLKVETSATEKDTLISNFAGIYYKMADDFHAKPCFQRVSLTTLGRLVCPGQYLFWSARRNGWKIGALDDSKAGWALCCDDVESPALISKPWLVWEPPYYILDND